MRRTTRGAIVGAYCLAYCAWEDRHEIIFHRYFLHITASIFCMTALANYLLSKNAPTVQLLVR